MLEPIIQLDRKIFYYINDQWSGAVMDWLAPILREPYTWAPLYLFLALFALINFRLRGLWWCMFFIITFAISDQTSLFLKGAVGRLRPCHDAAVAFFMHQRVPYCPSSGSFTSNHASNHFALAMFCFMTLWPYFGRYNWLFFVWAAAVSYSQVYVGVHYPFDVLAGGILGAGIGWLSSYVFNRRIGLIQEPAAA